MIIRLTAKLAAKLGVTTTEPSPPDPNPFADWSAHLFTAGHRQYLLITNTCTLYSVVMPGKGITSPGVFLTAMRNCLAEYLAYDELGSAFDRLIVPAMDTIRFSKALNRSVTGSMNDLIHLARCYMADGDMSLLGASYEMNKAPMSYLEHKSPGAAFRSLIPE